MDRILEKKTWTAKRIGLIVSASVVTIMAVYSLAFRENSSKVTISRDRITIASVRYGKFQEFIPINGSIVPIRTLYLDAIEGGRVEKRFLEAGSYVNQGDPILQLSNTSLLLDIMYREAELFQQSNNLRNTQLAMEQNRLALQSELLELDYQFKKIARVNERNRQLLEKNLISDREFDESNDEYDYLVNRRRLTMQSHVQDSIFRATQVDQLKASLIRMEENLALVKLNQENLLIRAPVSGHLTSLNAEIGESKVRGERLGQIDILDGFKAQIMVDEHYITRVRPGQRGGVTLGAKRYELLVDKIYPEVINGQFQIDMTFIGPVPEDIRRGQTVRIRLALGDLTEATMIPRGGFFSKTGGQWVYVIGEDGAFATRRRIRLGRQNQDDYEILEGLEAGEQVITSSYDTFGDYDRIILNN
ncbi:MAG: HlyD family efflux transporter periplasmic adaptor subunit [Candidatus Marinimicrobia bacterium]|nr:HlyD family efflux transporter periplasmic adaptor subunit [Candidatus Neomarinimicrobiota bacterium]